VVLLATFTGPGVAGASTDRSGFVAQARAAGLTATQATGLQAKIDDYLTTLDGRGTQVSPNQIDMKGAVLNVTVPGEKQPRQLVEPTRAEYDVDYCVGGYAQPEWFCAYKYEQGEGDSIGMWACWNYSIPWFTVGSWMNNQTPGTMPRLYWTDGSSWLMPAAFSYDYDEVYWRVVKSITNC
jgi:hypothetical protein